MASIDKRAIFEGMTRTLPVLAFVVDAEGVFREIIANGYTDDFLFEEPSTAIGKSINELFATEKAESFAEHIDQALQTGVVQEFEYSLPIKGKTRRFEGYMAPMDADLDEEQVIWVAEDITERKERNLELERHEVFLESIREEVLVTDTDLNITYESAAVPKLYGYEQGERVGDPILEYVHPDDTEQVRAHFEEQLDESGPTQPIEYRGENKDGTWTWVESQARILKDHPAIGGVVITSRDISERVEHRKKRKRQHTHLENAEQLAEMGGWEYRPDTETVQLTEGAQQLFEISDSLNLELPETFNFYHETDQPKIEEAFEKCLESGVGFSIDAQIITNEGRQRWVESTGTRSTEDGVTKLTGVIQDITQHKGREQRLEVLNRVLRHNLRNELGQIQGYAEMINEHLPAESQEFHSKIVASADRLLALSEKSKKFTTAMAYNYVTGPVELEPLMEAICDEYREKYPDATIETELFDARAPGNEMAIRLIFEELFENALKHNNRDNPTVNLVVVSPEDNRVKIRISDNGPGLSELEQEVIQSGEETALQHSLGIGLWTTSWLVSELSGDMQVTATDDQGTTFTIKLPAEEFS
ncbi:sensor histidine kinase [Halanaeroarchaeum sulfurireducens]|uniref:histidine kinase n=1 Tax=Halanaeroarchaeum sulfurireducens TaxID=1604004 RepID=A0A0F7PBT9_9EURY|nr:PAS domain-containing sensor histidine kinase [Halanaeroarchaeum sulfurireducens]AKH97625.1 PAS-PAC-PAC sensing his kinase [Halanaeroarchaeum sulfurireducens]ALG82021.1 PAS-PAC-PAC sensing his kinase [Halanaeroarchaeum sulfurireducens]